MTLNYSDHREWTIKLLAYKYHVNNIEIERCVDTNTNTDTDKKYKQKLIADNILIDAEIKKRDQHILTSNTSSFWASIPLSGTTHSDTFQCSFIKLIATALANKLFDKYFSKLIDVVNVGATNVGATNVGATNVGAANVGATNVGAANVGAANVGAPNLIAQNVVAHEKTSYSVCSKATYTVIFLKMTV